MGPSGSGKSTLLNLIAGIDKPDGGRLVVAGEDITQLSESALAGWRAATVGFIFQFYNLMPVLDARGNVELPLLLTPLSRRQRRERAALMLELVGLADRMDHYPNELSGGQQQRVAIARAIVTDPAAGHRRRADRRPRPRLGRGHPRAARTPERRDGQDHRHGHPRSARRRGRAPPRSTSTRASSRTPVRSPIDRSPTDARSRRCSSCASCSATPSAPSCAPG